MRGIESRVRRLEDRVRNPYANDPRLAALATQLQAGVSMRTFSDDDLDYMIAWRRRQGGDVGIDVAAMSDEELERAADGDETVLARYRRKAR